MKQLRLKAGVSLLTFFIMVNGSWGQEWSTFSKDDGSIPSDEITDIAIGPDGAKYFATNGSGIVKRGGEQWSTINSNNSDLPFDYLKCLTVSSNGNFWFGTNRSGVYGQVGNQWKNITTDSLLPDDKVFDIAIGPNGSKWFGTQEGLVKLENGDTTTFSGLGTPKIKGITPGSGNTVWLAIGTGVARYDGQDLETVNIAGAPGLQSTSEIVIDNSGNVWAIGERIGLAKYNAANDEFEVNSTYDDDVTAIGVAENGNVWIGRSTGEIAYYDGNKWQRTKPANANIPAVAITAIEIDNNNRKWIGYDSDGIATSPKLGGGTTGLAGAKESKAFALSPNPVHDQLWLNVNRPDQITRYKVISSKGQVVKRGALGNGHQHQLSVNDLPSGVYFLNVTGPKTSRVQKLVVQ